MKRVKDEQIERFVPQKRQGVDGKQWWVVWDNKYNKYSTYTCFGKYKTEKECEWAIKNCSEKYGKLLDSRRVKDGNEILDKLQSNLSEVERFLNAKILSAYNCVVVSNDPNMTWVIYKKGLRVNDFNINHVDELTRDAAEGAADFFTTGIKDQRPDVEFVVMKKIDFAKKIKDMLTDMLNFASSTPVSDSRKIKDADDTPLNGLLSIAFNDGTEDEMCKTVQQHANESGEINGIQYETYETDEQDGVAFVDLCAIGVSDPTEFVKGLLEKWGVLENTADIDFDTQTEEEYNEEVADSRKRVRDNKDYLFNNYKTFNPPVLVALNNNSTWEVEQIHLNDVKNDYISGGIIVTENIYQPIQKELASRRRTRCEFELDLTNNTITFGFYVPDKAKQTIIDLILENFGDYTISDSRVNDMTKPIRWKAYAERMRAKRRDKNVEPTDEPENEKQDVADSRRVRDERQTFKGQYIGDSPFAKQYESFVDELLKSGKMKRGDLSQADIHNKFEDEMLETSESGDDFEVWAYNDDPRFGDYGRADAGIFVEYDKDGYVTDIYTVG